MLYRITLAELDANGNIIDPYTRIASHPASEDGKRVEWSTRLAEWSVPITDCSQVTTDELARAIESEMEGNNFHGETRMVGAWIAAIVAVVGEDKAREIVWSLIQEHGLLVGAG